MTCADEHPGPGSEHTKNNVIGSNRLMESKPSLSEKWISNGNINIKYDKNEVCFGRI